MSKVKVDQDKCIGCGTCIALCSEVFEYADNGKARVVNEKGCGVKCDCQQAVDSCPVGAISTQEK
ncbi:MAG: ferredoxin [Candidatus Komeilibacteria bacterium CG_4_10_14_0_2_um_filter_37_10]|uniref:Ferredoxin n=1 Tax=Candidatus Komeilibacteria bacterium CG_4_10_14_0_2_um_filter_37_10 TaxID=1974470 RepID=A0A2M7VGQ7_9BACT|nr:MAG: ferredoxin [Candidatus Komeilibacteria bacterium CG_4_10_14_0_2_um_filter_37_10]PJA94134.1 MAG: ferredoxin [Candidatus Komeilibacteria bacterium CG_4_9_14_3_um_filter_37_5]